MRRSFIRCAAVLVIGIFLGSLAARADLEVRREMAAPGDLVATLPSSSGERALVARLATPSGASVSALVEWTPADRELTIRVVSTSNPDQLFVSLKGPSPIVIGSRTDTAGPVSLIVTDPVGGTESIVIRAMVNWAISSGSSERPARRDPTPTPARLDPPAPTADPARIVETSWREEGDLPLATVRRDGLTIRFSGAVHPEMARKALRVEIGFPGRRPGLIAYEEAVCDVRVLGDRLLLFLPQGLTLTESVPARLTLDGDRLLGRNGVFVDADGSGLTLPTGDGRPGGLFRSAFRLVP